MKRILTLLLCAALLIACAAPACALPAITDKETEADYHAQMCANALNALGLFRGTGNGYALDEPVTRAQAVTMLVRFLGAEGDAMVSSVGSPFTDVPQTHWAAPYTTYAKLHGITEGTSETTFSPDAPVTGPQMTKLILAALGYEGLTLKNAYAKGIGAQMLVNSPLKRAVLDDKNLIRADLVRFFHAALLAKRADGTLAYEFLIERGVFTKEKFEEVMMAAYNTPAQPSEPVDFARNLLDTLAKTEDGNVTVSPLSVKLALAMAAAGAEGETRAEMLKVLGIADPDAFGKSAAELIDRVAGDENVTFSIADAIFLNEDVAREAGVNVDFKDSYKKTVQDYYRAEAKSVTKADAVKTVNGWVARQTREKITSLISSPDFLACLVNAIYFYGDWEVQFDVANTFDGTFHAASGDEQTVPMMHMTKYLDYWGEGDVQVLRLPYRGGEFSMLIGLGEPDGSLADYLPKLESTRVAVTLPKFEIEYGTSLKKTLETIGMKKVFTNDAELGGMFDGTSAKVSDVIHKTYLHVTERGTEAAAATAVMVMATGMITAPPVEFTADRPFTWCILDEITGEILFSGLVRTLR